MFSRLKSSKAFWLGVTAIVTAFGAHFQAPELVGWVVTLQAVGVALMGIFLRDGIAKNGA